MLLATTKVEDLEAGWQSFVTDLEVPAILEEAGHVGKPQAATFGGRCAS